MSNSSTRKRFTDDQILYLTFEFKRNPLPSRSELNRLSTELNVELRRLGRWFENKRARYKRINTCTSPPYSGVHSRAQSENRSSYQRTSTHTPPAETDRRSSVDEYMVCDILNSIQGNRQEADLRSIMHKEYLEMFDGVNEAKNDLSGKHNQLDLNFTLNDAGEN